MRSKAGWSWSNFVIHYEDNGLYGTDLHNHWIFIIDKYPKNENFQSGIFL